MGRRSRARQAASRHRARRWGWLFGGAAVDLLMVLGGYAGGLFSTGDGPQPEPPPGQGPPPRVPLDLPAVATSSYQNATTHARYVGSAACRECHGEQHASWQATPHSRALAEVAPDKEPDGAVVRHPMSGRGYQVYRRDGEFRHREFTGEGQSEMTLADHAIRYVIGSGNHSRSYLLELDGFLVESPVTWYASRKAWGMSPGYEGDAFQPGFARPAEYACIRCHAGQVTAVDGALHKLEIREPAIGCERCHGPGALHVQRHQGGDSAQLHGRDLTIVNPADLDRAHQESICGQCHLTHLADVELRGRSLDDYRPGLLLDDFQVGFRLADAPTEMTVVGHVEQMRLSRCYSQSQELTCTTCHDPHHQVAGERRVENQRATCLSCHSGAGVTECGLPVAQRKQKAGDNCIACHMPATDTDIPHFAFTHHRIGIHSKSTGTSSVADTQPRSPKLVPVGDDRRLPAADRDRNLGLAYLLVAHSDQYPSFSADFERLARTHLEQAREAGISDPRLCASLAQVLWRQDPPRTVALARSALNQTGITPKTRHDAQTVFAATVFAGNDWSFAEQQLNRVVKLRRNAEDWLQLGVCRQRRGASRDALAAVTKAAEIDPFSPQLQQFLAQLHRQNGDHQKAQQHAQRADRLAAQQPAQ